MEKTAIVKIHPRSFSEEDLIINLDFFGKPKLQQDNLIQISLQDDQSKSLCLQVKELPLEIQPKGGAVTIGTAAAQALGINGMTNVVIRKVTMQDVTIGLTQLKIKNQYIGRSDMWRLTNSLMDTCVYVGKTIQFAGIRVQVDKLWRQGEIVSSGAVASDSRVVFRSASAQMFLFIQVCAEITDFDSHGDQYFDKAMNGFMKQLFEKLKESECNHLATIVLFSRTYYYKAKHKDDFPVSMRNNILRDCKGQFYQDYYNVIGEIRTESESEWAHMIIKTKKAFMQHLSRTNCCQEDPNTPIGTLSKSFQGNFLEAINLTTNALSINNIDLNLTMSGQAIIIVTPGVGVFEVDRKVYAMTNSKVSDLCIGVDVICLTEQPFHAIPLLMFQSKSTAASEKEDFTTPDWMNYSFYNPQSVWSKGQFEPRIKLSDHLINKYLHNQAPPTPLSVTPQSSLIRTSRRGSKASITDQRLLQRTDYDDHDEQIFQRRILVQHSISGMQQELYRHRSDEELRIDYSKFDEETLSDDDDNVISTDSNSDISVKLQTGKTGHTMELSSFTGSLSVTPRARFLSTGSTLHSKDGIVTGTTSNMEFGHGPYYSPQHARRSAQRRKPIVNPFVPQKVHQNVTANKRKWMHVFPRNRDGHAFQPHHDISTTSLSASRQNLTTSVESDVLNRDTEDSPSSLLDKKPQTSRLFGKVRSSEGGCQPIVAENFAMTRRMGTDWESVVMPACLPITTDYFPSQKELEQKFSEYNYYLSHENSMDTSENGDDYQTISPWSSPRKHMGPIESLREVISQRISLGFQLVLDDRYPDLYQLHNELSSFSKITPDEYTNFKVSLGRVHHRIVLTYPDIKIIMYNPAEKYEHNMIHQLSDHEYNYQLCAPCQQNYQTRRTVLKHEGAENFNWNYVDQHILGYQDFAELPESSRYQKFRCRYLLLPTEQMWVGKQDSQLVMGFVKMLDFLNHIKRRQHTKWNTTSTPSRPRMSTPASPNPLYNASRPVEITSRRISTPHSSYSKTKSFDEDRSHTTKEPRMLSPENRTRHTPSRSLHYGVDATDLLKPKKHFRRKSETDFLDTERRKSDPENERVSTSYIPDDCKGSLEELTEAVGSSMEDTEKHGEEQRTDSSKSGDTNEKTYKQIKRHTSLTSLTAQGIKTSPASRRKGALMHRSLDVPDYHVESGSLLSPVKANPAAFTTSSPMADIINALTNEEKGIELVSSHAVGLQCFIAMEMVTWLQDNIDDIEFRRQAVRFAQEMVDNRVIVHVSDDFNVTFKDGYHLFKIVKNSGNSDDKTYYVIDNRGGDQLKTHWFEVSILQPSQMESRIESLTTTPSSRSSTSSTQGDSLPYYMQDSILEEQQFTDKTVPERAFVELTPDPQKLSDRPEWCFVHYNSTYHPSRSFEFEFQWVVSTAALLSQLVQSWSRKAHMYGFNLVRVPLSSNLSCDDNSSCPHPFRSPQHIPLCLSTECYGIATQKGFVQAVAERFGFLPDLDRNGHDDLNSLPSQHNNTMYVHYTGSVLIKAQWRECTCNQNTDNHLWTTSDVNFKPVNTKDVLSTSLDTFTDDQPKNEWIVCGFWWYNNHFVDITTSTQDLLNSFQAFCQDLDKQLQKFCTQFVH